MGGTAELSPSRRFAASGCLYARPVTRGKVQASPKSHFDVNGLVMQLSELLETDAGVYEIQTSAQGPQGELPLTDEILKTWSSGDLFGLTQAAGMGWKPEDLLGEQ